MQFLTITQLNNLTIGQLAAMGGSSSVGASGGVMALRLIRRLRERRRGLARA